jgi:hypothetical protein
MIDKIEFDLVGAIAVRHRRGRQTVRRNIKRDVPPMIDKRRLGEPNLPDNLRPRMEGRKRVLPLFKNQSGPGVLCHYGKDT